jgi:hypothetical protein
MFTDGALRNRILGARQGAALSCGATLAASGRSGLRSRRVEAMVFAAVRMSVTKDYLILEEARQRRLEGRAARTGCFMFRDARAALLT